MLAIRMQRTGRKGHAMFRVIVQDSRRTPTSGKIVAQLGSYDPHAKSVILDKEKAAFYLEHGAQPSERTARLLKSEGVGLPAWVSLSADKDRATRHAEKRRSTSPATPVAETAIAEAEPEAVVTEEPATPAEEPTPAAETETAEAATPVAEEPAEAATDDDQAKA